MAKKETYLTCRDGNVFEGMTSISAIIQKNEQDAASARKIIRVLFDASKIKSKRREFDFLKRKASEFGFAIDMVSTEEIDELSTGTTHGGVIAFCEPREIPMLSENIQNIKKDGIYIFLDGIEDPYNFGYAVRSIYASGVDGIFLSERNWMDVAGIVAKSSAGTSELADMFIATPLDAVNIMKQLGYRIVAAGIRDSVSMYAANFKKPIMLIVGGEKRGISASLLSAADEIVRIEYGRNFRGSLSAASAATILSYEIFRQNSSFE
jgi:23S rRNA (guanosine2251-2'-O)-methyltransferase